MATWDELHQTIALPYRDLHWIAPLVLLQPAASLLGVTSRSISALCNSSFANWLPSLFRSTTEKGARCLGT